MFLAVVIIHISLVLVISPVRKSIISSTYLTNLTHSSTPFISTSVLHADTLVNLLFFVFTSQTLSAPLSLNNPNASFTMFSLVSFTLITESIPYFLTVFIQGALQAIASYTITSAKWWCFLYIFSINLFAAVISPSSLLALSFLGFSISCPNTKCGSVPTYAATTERWK